MKSGVIIALFSAILFQGLSCFAIAAPAIPDIPGQASKLMIYRATGTANSCGPGCDHWIAVEGKVDSDAAARVRRFLNREKDTSLPFYLYSPGGDLQQGLSIGRMLRARRATARIGQTIAKGCEAGSQIDDACLKIKGAGEEVDASVVVQKAQCNSACGYLFLGATTREVPVDAMLGVHSSRILLKIIGRPSLSQRQEFLDRMRDRSDSELTSYLRTMGISHELFDMVKTIKFENMRPLTRQELYRFGIDKREFVDTAWTVVTTPRPLIRKFAIERRDDATPYRPMEWLLSCDASGQSRLTFTRQADVGMTTSLSMMAGSAALVPFATKRSNFEIWTVAVKPGVLKNFLTASYVQMVESTNDSGGKLNHQVAFKIETAGLEAGWAQISAACTSSLTDDIRASAAAVALPPPPSFGRR